MKILFIGFYHPPDLSAGSYRTSALIDELLKVMPPKSQIEVITSLRKRYNRFSAGVPKREEQQGVVIYRMRLPKHRNSFFGQSLSFLVFAIGAIKIARGERPDLVFGRSSGLMTAILASFVLLIGCDLEHSEDLLRGCTGKRAFSVFVELFLYILISGAFI